MCVEVHVQFSGNPEGGVVPPLGGKLVRRESFSVINCKPITVTLEPSDSGWKVRSNSNQKVSLYVSLMNDVQMEEGENFSLNHDCTFDARNDWCRIVHSYSVSDPQ